MLEVLFFRNKLDGNDYAIKRIPLDPRDEKLNRKVMREAKLFSGLCHTNVVRYFSAWIEHVPKPSSPSRSTTAEKAEEGERQSSCESTSQLFCFNRLLETVVLYFLKFRAG